MEEVTTQGWFSRIGDSIKGILFGIVLFFASFVLLWWNEGQAVAAYKDIKAHLATAVVLESPDKIDPSNDGRAVHLTGRAVTDSQVTDADFGISENAIRLQRSVEIYQWRETSSTKKEKQLGGSEKTVKTYSHEKVWVGSPISSSNFKEPEGHENKRTSLPFGDYTSKADKVTVGAFTLSTGVQDKISGGKFPEPLRLDANSTTVPEGGQLSSNEIYLGKNPSSPEIDDVRIRFTIVPQQVVSVAAKQVGSKLDKLMGKTGDVSRVAKGEVSLEQMLVNANKEVKIKTWILRAIGFFMMFFGIGLVLKPLSVIADVVPFIGSIVGAGTSIIAGLVAGVLTLVTIAIAWVAHRPLVSIPLLVLAGGLMFLIWKKKRDATPVVAGGAGLEEAAAADVPPPPPPPPPAG